MNLYRSDSWEFYSWCLNIGKNPSNVDQDNLSSFIIGLASRLKLATIERKLYCAVLTTVLFYNPLNHTTKAIKSLGTFKSIKRKLGKKQRQALAFSPSTFEKRLLKIDISTFKGRRDKAILLLGYAGCFRVSELQQLNIEDIQYTDYGLFISINRSKTNQEQENQFKVIQYGENEDTCPVELVKKLIEELPYDTGPIFISKNPKKYRTGQGDSSFKRITIRTAQNIIKKHLGDKFSSHSLRVSSITNMRKNGARKFEIMQQSNHKNPAMIDRYTQVIDVAEFNASKYLGL